MPTIKQYRGLYDSRYLLLSGSNANQNIDIGIYSFTLGGNLVVGINLTVGGDIVAGGDITADDGIFGGDVIVTGDVTANTFYGDGSNLTGVGISSGSVISYGAAVAPVGWLLCNGAAINRITYGALFTAIGTTFGIGDGATTFNVPDLRGIFQRGTGTSGKLSNANGVAFAGVLGTYQNDKIQSHEHREGSYTIVNEPTSTHVDAAGVGIADEYRTGISRYLHYTTAPLVGITGAGTTRVGHETNPANLGVTFIIKY